MNTSNNTNLDFIKEQYIQLNEHRRQVNSFSWQIATIAFAGLVLVLGFNPNILKDWAGAPTLPAIGFLLLFGLVFVLLSSHCRNQATRRWLDNLVRGMEDEFGADLSKYGFPTHPEGTWFLERWRSSRILTGFLITVDLLALAASAYYAYYWWLLSRG